MAVKQMNVFCSVTLQAIVSKVCFVPRSAVILFDTSKKK